MSKLARLRLHNFKGKRSEWAIAPKMLLVGPNGAGKSALLQAVMVGILGYEPRLGRTPASVVQLASDREMSVEIETDAKFILHRTFKLSRGRSRPRFGFRPIKGRRIWPMPIGASPKKWVILPFLSISMRFSPSPMRRSGRFSSGSRRRRGSGGTSPISRAG
ncbi:MAG: AAA family ATPase [Candidatus Manganitrophus sp.]|nr:MAG: AAA family ATPase [Candidatus Manganitrophus sp.]